MSATSSSEYVISAFAPDSELRTLRSELASLRHECEVLRHRVNLATDIEDTPKRAGGWAFAFGIASTLAMGLAALLVYYGQGGNPVELLGGEAAALPPVEAALTTQPDRFQAPPPEPPAVSVAALATPEPTEAELEAPESEENMVALENIMAEELEPSEEQAQQGAESAENEDPPQAAAAPSPMVRRASARQRRLRARRNRARRNRRSSRMRSSRMRASRMSRDSIGDDPLAGLL